MLDSIIENGIEGQKKVGNEAKKGQNVGFFFDNMGNYNLKLIIPKMFMYFALISIIIITFMTKIYMTENIEINVLDNVSKWLLYNIQYIINIKINIINEAGTYLISFLKQAGVSIGISKVNIELLEIENKTPQNITILIYSLYSIFISIYLYLSLLQFKAQQDLKELGMTFLYIPLWAVFKYEQREKNQYYYAKVLTGNKYRPIPSNFLTSYILTMFNRHISKSEQVENIEKTQSFLLFYKYKKMGYITKTEIIKKQKQEEQKKEQENRQDNQKNGVNVDNDLDNFLNQ